ncbi:MAG: SDR family NAD(P)-dependent oxidoreductase [Bacteroidota bacterium]
MVQKIIIVGATSGIGRRLAERYAEEGNRIGITGRRKELLEQIQQQYLQQTEHECFDITGTENVPRLEALVKKMGGLDTLIISAGTGESSKELNWAIDKTTVDTNVNGFIEIANWAFNYFMKQGYGRLAAISSVGANRGGLHAPAYNASKAFQSSYAYGLSLKAGRLNKNVSVTCIEPGFLATKMAKSNKLFWVVPVDKAARQIIRAIEKRKRKVYISRRWWLVAKALKWAPHWLYRRIG